MPNQSIPDLVGWEAYCEGCLQFWEVRRVEESDAGGGGAYFEFVCNTCHMLLLAFRRSKTAAAAPA
jgi:hypothetical protein